MGNCCCCRIFCLSAFSDLFTQRLSACSLFFPTCHVAFLLYTIQFSAFPSSLISLFSLSFSFSLWLHASVALMVFYSFQFNLSLSPIKLNANSTPPSPSFCLAWPFTLLPALASLQPHTLLFICLVPLTRSSSHPYYSLVLFLETQLLFYSDLALLNST